MHCNTVTSSVLGGARRSNTRFILSLAASRRDLYSSNLFSFLITYFSDISECSLFQVLINNIFYSNVIELYINWNLQLNITKINLSYVV